MRLAAHVCISTTVLILASCASTNTENPYYQASTKYKGSSPYSENTLSVQQANYETQTAAPISYQPQQASYTQVNQECLSTESNRKIIGTATGGVVGGLVGRKVAGDNKTLGTIAGAAIGGAAGYGIADKTINCDPVTISAPQAAPITPAYSAQTYQTSVSVLPALPVAPGIVETTESHGPDGTPGYYAVNGIPEEETSIAQNTNNPVPEPVAIPVAAPTPLNTLASGNIRHEVIKGDTVYSLARNACVSVSELKQANSINDDFYIRVGDAIQIPASRCGK